MLKTSQHSPPTIHNNLIFIEEAMRGYQCATIKNFTYFYSASHEVEFDSGSFPDTQPDYLWVKAGGYLR